ncbi:MAG: sigma-70 family RNA polymerase sigma factor [Kiritimatiellae bacterium]|nr:sigma-70 family RNA polymerase sigma factor [Kiritimatiellia bacterium]
MEEDSELLYAYSRRGDVESLSALVRRHAVWMQAFLRGLLPTVADAEDAFQETWVRVVKAAGKYRGGRVRPYLAVVARSAAIDRLRQTGRVVSLDAEDGDGASAAERLADEAPLPDERFESKATAEDVRAAVRALPEGPRQVLLMRIEGELSFKEIASELGVPLGTTLTWMRTAKLKLKDMLGGAK